MKILLIGYGRMGQAIERLATERGHQIVGKIDVQNMAELSNVDASEVDVAIEFTRPESAFNNLKICVEKGIKVISGTTGWLDQFDELVELCKQNDGTFLYASNYSLGVNLFFELNRRLARMMNPHKSYEPIMEEIHHTHKLDSPSGTAITLAEGVIDNNDLKKSWVNETKNNDEELEIISFREGEVPGTHTVKYKSEMDEIEIKHTAHTRDSFALGAVVVAEWVSNQKGILTMQDFLQLD